ncbi:MAG: cupin domain-containing protein [Geminicoccaceae bacterium]
MPVPFAVRFQRDPDQPAATHEWYADRTGTFTAGYWAHEGGVMECHYTEEEFCVLLDGVVRLTAEDGQTAVFRKDDGFVIPKGFKGTWETVEPVRKWYVIWQPPG